VNILLPKTYYPDLQPDHGPLFFFAGPVLGGGDWHVDGCGYLQQVLHEFVAALPCRYKADHVMRQYELQGGTPDHFPRQLPWERLYMEQAAREGCLAFWLPCESRTEPRTDGNPYAMDTRGELGAWRILLKYNRALRVVIGAEPDFPGLSTIKRNLEEDLGADFPIHHTLYDTMRAAATMVRTA
jgi:hypothetical protein